MRDGNSSCNCLCSREINPNWFYSYFDLKFDQKNTFNTQNILHLNGDQRRAVKESVSRMLCDIERGWIYIFFDILHTRVSLSRFHSLPWLSKLLAVTQYIVVGGSFSITIAFVAWLLHVSRELIIKILQAKLKLLKCGTFEYCYSPTIGHDCESRREQREKWKY